jgi:hypothetical protein
VAITQAVCNSFRVELMQGYHLFNSGGSAFKMALYTSAANIGATTTTYTSSGEVSGPGYAVGGNQLSGQNTFVSGTTAFVDFSDVQWGGATFTARGALIYNFSSGNRAVCVLDFGADRVTANSTFQVRFPTPSITEAILRIT